MDAKEIHQHRTAQRSIAHSTQGRRGLRREVSTERKASASPHAAQGKLSTLL